MNQLQKQADEIRIPDNLDDLIKSSMKSCTRHKIGKRIFASFLSVILLYAALIGVCCASSTAADTLSNLPVVGYLFRNFTDKDLKKASETGLTQIVNQSVTMGDTTVTVTEVYYDVNSFSVCLSYENYDAVSHCELYYKDKLITDGGSGGLYTYKKGHPTSQEVNLPLKQALPDTCIVKLVVEEGRNSHRKFEFEIPLNNARANAQSKQYPVNQTITDGMSKLVVKSIVFTPYATTVTYEYTYPDSIVNEGSGMALFTPQLLDSKGSPLTFKEGQSNSEKDSGGYRTESKTAVFGSLSDIPDTLTLNILLSNTEDPTDKKIVIGRELQLGE